MKKIILSISLLFVLGMIGCSSGSKINPAAKYPEAKYVYREIESEPISNANTFYVAKNGNDANSGSESQPWLTIQKAANTLLPGQMVYIKKGVYNERVTVTKSGSSGKYIIFSAYPNHQVVLDGSGITPSTPTEPNWGGLFHVKSANYIKIKGLKVRNTTAAGIFSESSNYIVIQSNYSYNTFSSGIATWNSNHIIIDGNEVVWACNPESNPTGVSLQECITVAGCTDFEVKYNEVHHNGTTSYNGGEGINAKHSITGSIHHNNVHDLKKVGIYVDAWNTHSYDILLYSNTVYHCKFYGLVCAAESGGTLNNVNIYNNLIYENAAVGIGIEGGANWGVSGKSHFFKNIAIYNNTIFYNQYLRLNWGTGININAPQGENIYIRNNICYKNFTDKVTTVSGGTPKNLVTQNNLEGPNPLFVDQNNINLHLKGGSPAIDAAYPINGLTTDFGGKKRPNGNGYDIGAYEF